MTRRRTNRKLKEEQQRASMLKFGEVDNTVEEESVESLENMGLLERPWFHWQRLLEGLNAESQSFFLPIMFSYEVAKKIFFF